MIAAAGVILACLLVVAVCFTGPFFAWLSSRGKPDELALSSPVATFTQPLRLPRQGEEVIVVLNPGTSDEEVIVAEARVSDVAVYAPRDIMVHQVHVHVSDERNPVIVCSASCDLQSGWTLTITW